MAYDCLGRRKRGGKREVRGNGKEEEGQRRKGWKEERGGRREMKSIRVRRKEEGEEEKWKELNRRFKNVKHKAATISPFIP